MKSRFLILALIVFSIAALAVSDEANAGPKPDVVITQYGLKSWGTCAPGKTVFTFAVTVENKGPVSWPENLQPVLVVEDIHPGVLGAWGVGIGINPPLAPGKSVTLEVPMGYYAGNPKHMTADAPHPFQSSVGPTSYDHTGTFALHPGPGPAIWHGKRVIMVGAPKDCPKGG
jgi:hypothetical protein